MSELTGQEKISERNKIFFWGVFFFLKKRKGQRQRKRKGEWKPDSKKAFR
jgi:hypothetical protein